jgi:hypothetical protein
MTHSDLSAPKRSVVRQVWHLNLPAILGLVIASIWVPFPLYEIVRYWPSLNDGFILVFGGLLLGIVGIAAGFDERS